MGNNGLNSGYIGSDQRRTQAGSYDGRKHYLERILGGFQFGNLWTPAQISTELWLDAADASTITIATGVSQWNDKSGNARNATQATAAKQPTYSATGLNNLPTIIFDGSNDFLTNAYSFGNSPSSAYIVFQSSLANGTFGQIFMVSPNPSNVSIATELLYMNNIGGYTTITYKPPSLSNSALGVSTSVITTPQILSVAFDGSGTSPSDTAFSLNGTLQTSTTSGPVGYSSELGFSIGGRPVQQTAFLNARISEFIFCSSFLSTNDRQLIEGYLAHKWGLTSSLPNDHPYKNAAP